MPPKTKSKSKSKAAPKKRKSSSSPSGGGFTRFRISWNWKVLLAAVAGTGAVVVVVVYSVWASFFDLRQLDAMPQRTWLYDCTGKPFSRLAGEDRISVSIDKVSPNFINALLAREDSRFYKHFGVDPIGIMRASFRNLIHLHAREGASTITQQLARNSFPEQLPPTDRSLQRKLLEAFVAMRIEHHLTKKQILQRYVNRIYFGSGFYGIETASRSYFGKPSANLTLSEGAILAGLIRSPSRFSPFHNLALSLKQRDTVLDRMAQLGMITAGQAAAAKSAPVNLAQTRPPAAEEGYAMDQVGQELITILGDDQLSAGGFKIYTTIDPILQQTAQASLDAELTKIEQKAGYSHPTRAEFGGKTDGTPTPYLQGSVMVIDNATGGIRAIVGGRNYQESTYDRATLSARQVGSTFKPFVYAAAYAGGLSPTTLVDDGPIRRGELKDIAYWPVKNSDGGFGGLLPAEEGLIRSRNTMSVRIGDRAGLPAVRNIAKNAGLGDLPKYPSIFLGAFTATLKDMTVAYTAFPNGGVRHQPYIIDHILDSRGHLVYRAAHIDTRVLSPGIASMVTSGLQKVMERGTAANNTFHHPAAGKTGTTNECCDAWFIGYTRSLTCGVWTGLDKPTPIMPKGYGATLALPVWCDVMNAAVAKDYPSGSLPSNPDDRNARPARERHDLPERLFRSFRHLFGG